MPIYEYGCEKCGNGFETLIRNKADEAELRCPSCGGVQLHRRLSIFGVTGAVEKPITGSSGSSACGGCTAKSCAGCH